MPIKSKKQNPENSSWFNGCGIFAFFAPDFFRIDTIWDVIGFIPGVGDWIAGIMTSVASHWSFAIACWLFGACLLYIGIRRDYNDAKENQFPKPLGRWFLFFVIVTSIILMTIFLPPVSKRIPAPDTYYETQYNDDKYDWDGSDQNHSLARDGRSAFYAGDYGYAIYFFSQFQTNIQKNQNMSLGANIPLLAAAKFHQNPTLAGYKTFINDLNNLADEIQKQLDGQHGWFTNSIVIPDTQKQLKAVERLLSSPTEKRDVQNVIDRIDTIVSANQK